MSFGLRDKSLKTKKALREAVASGQDPFVFDTSMFGNRGTIPVSQLQSSDVIVGPDVERDRRWYANVKNGKVV